MYFNLKSSIYICSLVSMLGLSACSSKFSSSKTQLSSNGGLSVDDAGSVVPNPTPSTPDFPANGFCSEGGTKWAFCEDFDGLGMTNPASVDFASLGIQYSQHTAGTLTKLGCDSTLAEGKNCSTYARNGSLFMNTEDGGFGLNVLRAERPFDFSGREGRIHLRTEMKGHGRMKQTIYISPVLSNSLPDLRFPEKDMATTRSLAIQFQGDGGWPFEIVPFKDGMALPIEHVDGDLNNRGIRNFDRTKAYDLDLYISRNRVRITMDGIEIFNKAVDVGFDIGYVYFAQLAYNPLKDPPAGLNTVGDAGNRFLWDNFAFDGPVLAKNSLIPAGKKVVLFRAYAKRSCTIHGQPAQAPFDLNVLYVTWRGLVDANTNVTLNDIRCESAVDYGLPQGETIDIGDLHIVERGT